MDFLTGDQSPARRPKAGVDYPSTFVAFQEFFPDDESCFRYLEGCVGPRALLARDVPLHAGIGREHLPYDEFTFRFNRRTSRARGLLFYRLLEYAVRIEHTSTSEFYMNTGRGRRKDRKRAETNYHNM